MIKFSDLAGSFNGSQRILRGLANGDETTAFGTMYKIYILKSKVKDWYYTGHTSDMNARLKRHNCGKNRSTRPYFPFEVVYAEKYETKGEAFGREMQIKRYRGGAAFNKLVGK